MINQVQERGNKWGQVAQAGEEKGRYISFPFIEMSQSDTLESYPEVICLLSVLKKRLRKIIELVTSFMGVLFNFQ